MQFSDRHCKLWVLEVSTVLLISFKMNLFQPEIYIFGVKIDNKKTLKQFFNSAEVGRQCLRLLIKTCTGTVSAGRWWGWWGLYVDASW